MSNQTQYVIEDGLVKKGRFVASETIPLKDFFENLQRLAPQSVNTPPLPAGCVKYYRSASDAGGQHKFIIFQPARIRTIFYSTGGPAFRQTGTPQPYNIAFPNLLFKLSFNSAGNVSNTKIAVVKQRPTRDQEQIFYMRMPNVRRDQICMTPQSTPGDFAESCNRTIDAFWTGQSFNDDWAQYPRGVASFEDWQAKSEADPRFLDNQEWEYCCTMGEWVTRQ